MRCGPLDSPLYWQDGAFALNETLNETHERDFFANIARALATDARSRRPMGTQRLSSAAEAHARLGTP